MSTDGPDAVQVYRNTVLAGIAAAEYGRAHMKLLQVLADLDSEALLRMREEEPFDIPRPFKSAVYHIQRALELCEQKLSLRQRPEFVEAASRALAEVVANIKDGRTGHAEAVARRARIDPFTPDEWLTWLASNWPLADVDGRRLMTLLAMDPAFIPPSDASRVRSEPISSGDANLVERMLRSGLRALGRALDEFHIEPSQENLGLFFDFLIGGACGLTAGTAAGVLAVVGSIGARKWIALYGTRTYIGHGTASIAQSVVRGMLHVEVDPPIETFDFPEVKLHAPGECRLRMDATGSELDDLLKQHTLNGINYEFIDRRPRTAAAERSLLVQGAIPAAAARRSSPRLLQYGGATLPSVSELTTAALR